MFKPKACKVCGIQLGHNCTPDKRTMLCRSCRGEKRMTKSRYGVSKREVQEFSEIQQVRSWLGKYRKTTAVNFAHALCRYFKWLRVVQKIELTPEELLNQHVKLRSSDDIRARRQHLRLVLDHTRDNPDWRGYTMGRKYTVFQAIKSFYDYFECPLTTAKNVFGVRSRRVAKKVRKQITLAQAKQILGAVGQRERTILLIMLQSGMEIGAVVNKFSYMWDKVVPEVEAGKLRIKVELLERKGNGFSYFTYISYDAVQELKKWLLFRKHIVREFGEPEDKPIFITKNGGRYGENNYYQTLEWHKKRRDLPDFVPHQFRKLFKTEAGIPERGIDPRVVKFWMGHITDLDDMGSIYDRTPEIYEDVIEREYMKLEPYINIYSSRVAVREADPLLEDIAALSELPGVREEFTATVKDLKDRVDQILRQRGGKLVRT